EDGTHSVFLADMCGDGLLDLVRVRQGEVCYWPNLGYGHFGPRVVMNDSPWFDPVERFDPRRVHLADTDGSGTADLIYHSQDGVQINLNQVGNGWSSVRRLTALPPTTPQTALTTVDFLGTGTVCLVWSSAQPGDVARPLRYLDLMKGVKPHLLA